MDDYIFFIALMITFCSLAAAIILFLHFRRVEKDCNRRLVEGIHEQDRVKRELERTRIEKEAVEKVLTVRLSEVLENSLEKALQEGHAVGYENRTLRIDITYL